MKGAVEASVDRAENIAKSFEGLAGVFLATLENDVSLLGQKSADLAGNISSNPDHQLRLLHEIENSVRELRDLLGPSSCVSSAPRDLVCTSAEFLDYEVLLEGRVMKNKPSINSSVSCIFSDEQIESKGLSSLFCEVKFAHQVELSCVIVQGGCMATTPLDAPTLSPPVGNIDGESTFTVLPCGVGVDDCDGSIEKTVSSLADVISWENITKNNPPATVS